LAENFRPIDLEKMQYRESQSDKRLPPLNDAFVLDHQPMIESIASSIFNRSKLPVGVDYEDLVSWGGEGLIKAYNNYKTDRGTIFKTYAYYRVRGEIYDRIRAEWTYRNPTDYADQRKRIQERIADVVEEALDHSEGLKAIQLEERMNSLIIDSAVVYLVSIDGTDEHELPDSMVVEDDDQRHTDLWEAIEQLSDDERELVELFYVHGLTQKEISEKLSQSRSRVCRDHMKIIEKLRRRLLRRLVK